VEKKRALKAVLVLIGVIFTALVYPMIVFVKQDPALAMMHDHSLLLHLRVVGAATVLILTLQGRSSGLARAIARLQLCSFPCVCCSRQPGRGQSCPG